MSLTQALFVPLLQNLFAKASRQNIGDWRLDVFVTGEQQVVRGDSIDPYWTHFHAGRFGREELQEALAPPDQRSSTVGYVCGPPQMTDQVVEQLSGADGMEASRVFSEKW